MSNLSQKLVFDIETIGTNFDSLDELSKKYLLQYAEDEEGKIEVRERMSFSPLTGEVVAIGVLNPDTMKGAVYVRVNDQQRTTDNEQLEEGIMVEYGDERQIIERFWDIAKLYNCFISFNGRSFDAPFLMIRSAILGVEPTKNLLSNRYLNLQKYDAVHIDLFDQLTFYGAVRRKFNLHFWSRAFGIRSPKGEGITGDDVGSLYAEKKFKEIAKYNLGDLKATKELYDRWNQYLNFQ